MARKITRNLAADHGVPAWQRDTCFGCGPANPCGLQLHFALAEDGKSYACEFSLDSRFVGPPGHAHGGIIATILDEAMSKANKLVSQRLNGKVALTRRLQVEYLRPVPLGQPLVVHGSVSRMLSASSGQRSVTPQASGRVLYSHAELRNAKGNVLARSRGKFLTIDAEKMFARELENERRNAR